MFYRTLLAWLIACFYRLLSSSWRTTVIYSPEAESTLVARQKVIFAHWHGDELAIVQIGKPFQIAAITSTSKDGELMDRALRSYGVPTARGSSTRGGVGALKGLIDLGKRGFNPSVAVDGPKGPIYQVKGGVLEISRFLKFPIVPLAAAADKKFIFEKSWNQAYLPWPFAKVIIYFGKPILVEREHYKSRPDDYKTRLEAELMRCQNAAVKYIARM